MPHTVNIRHDFLAPKDRRWGLYLSGVGTRLSLPHEPYQVYENGAPYQWRNGRVLREYSLMYLTQGTGMFRVRGAKPLAVTAGDILLIRPGVWHDYAPAPDTGWQEYWTMFNGHKAETLIAQFKLPHRSPVMHYGLDESLRHLFTQMIDVAAKAPPFSDIIHSGLVLQLAASLLSRIQLLRDRGDREDSFVQQAKQRMADSRGPSLDMTALAKEFNISYSHFRRVFKASTGVAPRQYLLNLRINRAKQLIEDGGSKLSEVARALGFEDPFYFSRLFKQKTGVAPSQWGR